MSRIEYSKLIVESVEYLETLERGQTTARFRDYVRYIRYLKTGEAKSQQSSGAKIGLKARQSQNLWYRYQTEGLSKMLVEQRGSSFGYLSYHQISLLQSFLRDSQVPLTQIQIIDWLSASFGVVFTQGGLSDLLKRLKIKLKTGRPVNIRQNEADLEDFKKNFRRLSQQ
jgi:transposase